MQIMYTLSYGKESVKLLRLWIEAYRKLFVLLITQRKKQLLLKPVVSLSSFD